MKLQKYFKPLNKLNFLFVRRIVGNSMLPALEDGQFVLISRRLNKNLNNQVVIVSHQGIDKIKRVSFSSKDEVYLLGDNLNHSTDSRQFGLVAKENIIGRLIWPKI